MQNVVRGMLLLSVSAYTMSVHSFVTHSTGKPVKDAVVCAMPKERMAPTAWKTVIIAENNTFQPFVLPVQIGDAVSFVNRDKVHHNTPAKKFVVALQNKDNHEPLHPASSFWYWGD